MDREQEILNLIEEKNKLNEDTKNEIYSLDFELHKIEKEKVLKKFKIGDIIVHREKYLFKLTDIDITLGHVRTDRIIYIERNIPKEYNFQPQPVGRLWSILENARLANREEIERFNKAFKNG